MVTKAALEPNALAINLYTILPVADADDANGEIALGAGKQQSVSKPRIYFYDLLHCRPRARGYTPENGLGAPGFVVCVGCNQQAKE